MATRTAKSEQQRFAASQARARARASSTTSLAKARVKPIQATVPVAAAAPAPAAPAAPPAPAAPDPRDSQFFASTADIKAQRTGSLADLDRQQSYADTDLSENQRRLVEQRVQSLSNAKKEANKQGLFYSSTLTNRNRDVEKGYNDQETDVRNAYDRSKADRNSVREDIFRRLGRGDNDFGTEGAKLLAEAIARQLERDLLAPAPPAPAPVPVAAVPAASTPQSEQARFAASQAKARGGSAAAEAEARARAKAKKKGKK